LSRKLTLIKKLLMV